ncbi:MAG: N-glycosylase/DNA lyase [Aquificae bacterium]|nr:N-glycosylase/DNA lyase [Aquificota bacterium]
MKGLEEVKKAVSEVGPHVRKRIKEFERLGEEGRTFYDFRPFLELSFEADLFSELCFCILTANSSAVLGLRIQAELSGRGFWELSEEELTEILSSFGHRYARQRAQRITEARKKFGALQELLKRERNPLVLRELLSSPKSPYKIKGFGLKEASHFLRNTGFKDVAIVDRHIFRFLKEKELLPERKTITPKLYLEAEKALRAMAGELSMTLAELDLYIFYIKTKKVLK